MVMRTYGLSGSGMDVDQMVKDLMKAQRARYDTMVQKKTQVEWKKTDYNTMYTAVKDFRNTVFNYKLTSTLSPKLATVTDETKATAKATAEAANVSHSLDITQLAEGVKLTSSGAITTSAATDAKTTLAKQMYSSDATVPATFNLTISDGTTAKAITVDTSKSIYEFVSDINNSGLNVKANYDATLDRFFIASSKSGETSQISFTAKDAGGKTTDAAGFNFLENKLKISSGSLSTTPVTTSGNLNSSGTFSASAALNTQFADLPATFSLKLTNGASTTTIAVDTATNTLDDVLGAINAAGVNATAAYDPATGKVSLKTTSGNLSFSGSDGEALNFLQDNLQLEMAPQKGKNVEFSLDGVSLTQSSNSFTVSGITYSLKAIGTTTVGVTSDNDKAIANVKAFIESYNTVLSKLNGELTEDKYKDYMPLTADQRSSMSETEVKAWEEKAKSGMLRRDSILQQTVNDMRNNMTTRVSGVTGIYNSLSAIGITSGDYSENGKLYLDETKLKTALEADPEIVNKLFSTNGDTTSKQGVAVRLYDTLKTTMDKIGTAAGYSAGISADTESVLAKQIIAYNKQISNFSTRLTDMEDSYYTKFNAMETALSKLNQQSSWLSQQLGS